MIVLQDFLNKYYIKCPYRAINVFNSTKGEASRFGATPAFLYSAFRGYVVVKYDFDNWNDEDYMEIRRVC